jgi:hypothetical protein
MKLHTERNDIERFGVASERAFSIKTTAKAFDILSSGLYTDPKLAIVRELSCNAWDAHVAAGNADQAFEIHLPNSLEPWFHVRDFGTGLSDEDVMQLYTTYFDSTKSNSNAFIGALGLGSKSPFSYTKAFEVVSRFNGMRRTYSAFINEDGVPSIARLGEINTDEHNGLEVRITVAASDWYVFSEKTAKALRWFPIKPEVVGSHNFSWPEVSKERLEGEGWKMFEKNFAGDYSKMTAVQGNVAYKVDISKLELSASDTKILENAHIVGFFDIGDLEVAANREEIRYDDRSKAALIEKIKAVRAGVLKSVEDQVEALKDKPFWDVMIQLHTVAEQIFGNRNLFKEFVKETTNTQIREYVKIGGTLQVGSLTGHEISVFEQTHGKEGRTVKRKTFGSGVTPESHIVVFYNDLPVGGVARAMEWVRRANKAYGQHAPTAIVIRPKKDFEEVVYDPSGQKMLKKEVWTEQHYLTELTRLRQELGNVNFLLTSKDAPIPERARGSYKNELPIFQFSGIQGKYNPYIVWKRTPTIDLEKGGLYFHLQNGAHVSFMKNGVLENVNWKISDVEGNFVVAIDLINKHLKTDYSVKDIYGFGSQAIGKIKKNENWVNLFDVLKEVVKGYDTAVHYFDAIERTSDAHGIKTRCTEKSTSDFVKLVQKLDKDSAFRVAVLPLIEDHAKFGKVGRMVRFIRQINVDLGLGLFDNKVPGYFDDNAFKVYPMFSYISSISYSSGKDLTVLFDYIELIDRS